MMDKEFVLVFFIFASFLLAAREDVTTPTNLDQLLELVKVNSADEQEINQKREAEFNAKVNQVLNFNSY